MPSEQALDSEIIKGAEPQIHSKSYADFVPAKVDVTIEKASLEKRTFQWALPRQAKGSVPFHRIFGPFFLTPKQLFLDEKFPQTS